MLASEKWLLAVVLLLTALPAIAQQYKWTDDKGRIQYTDTPPPPSAKSVEKKSFKGSVVDSVTPYALTRAAKDAPVTLYTSPSCGDSCKNARAALNKRGVPFREVQVWDEKTNADLRAVSNGNEVPVLVVGRSVQKGFEQGALDRLLDLSGYPQAGIVRAGTQAAPPIPEGYPPKTEGEAAKPAAPEAADKK